MTVDEPENDPVLDGLARLRTSDVSQRHSERLRRRCHALLHAQPRPTRSTGIVDGTSLRRLIGPALAGVWCVAYLVEIVRHAAAVYGLRP